MIDRLPTLAIIGGTGALGGGLAGRWARAGYPVVIGSRCHEKAERRCSPLRTRPSRTSASSTTLFNAAANA